MGHARALAVHLSPAGLRPGDLLLGPARNPAAGARHRCGRRRGGRRRAARLRAGGRRTVAPDDPAAYRAAARLCEDGGYDAVCVQHEFGIFGGAAGRHVLEFLDGLTVPAVTTVHTVLGDPPADLRAALVDVAAASARIIALSPAAVPLLAGHGVDPARVAVIPHGVPPVPFEDPSRHKAAVGLDGHTVLLTFGLLSRNKGIELVLDAMPKLIATHPDVRYVVLGSTHPEVRRLVPG